MFDHSTHPDVAEWFARFGVAEVSYSGCSVDLTNEPPEHWFYKRNNLRPESLKLDLRIPSNGNCWSICHVMTSCSTFSGAQMMTCASSRSNCATEN